MGFEPQNSGMPSGDANHYTTEAAILQMLPFCLYKELYCYRVSIFGLLTFVSTPGGQKMHLNRFFWHL